MCRADVQGDYPASGIALSRSSPFNCGVPRRRLERDKGTVGSPSRFLRRNSLVANRVTATKRTATWKMVNSTPLLQEFMTAIRHVLVLSFTRSNRLGVRGAHTSKFFTTLAYQRHTTTPISTSNTYASSRNISSMNRSLSRNTYHVHPSH